MLERLVLWMRPALGVVPSLAAVVLLGVGAARASRDGALRDGYVNVSGHRMYYACAGSGRPTVVLDAGSPDTTTTWRWVQPQIARLTTVCAYDRAGLGRSAPPPPGHRTAQTQIHDLLTLLAAAHIPGPYVVVGHSWGGLLARLFAATEPTKTAGVVLLDATTFPTLTPAIARRLPRKTNKEGIDIAAAVAESAAVKTLRSLPLIVLGSDKPPPDGALLHAQDDEAALSSDNINAIVRQSTHYIQKPPPAGRPGVVVTAVSAVLEAVREHRRLPPCRKLFRPTAVSCRP